MLPIARPTHLLDEKLSKKNLISVILPSLKQAFPRLDLPCLIFFSIFFPTGRPAFVKGKTVLTKPFFEDGQIEGRTSTMK